MRPPLHAIAPSQSALRYLRQILFPRPYEYRPAMAANCTRLQQSRGGHFPKQQGLHAEALAADTHTGVQEELGSLPSAAPKDEKASVRRYRWRRKKNSSARPKLRQQIQQRIEPPAKFWHLQSSRAIHEKRLKDAADKWLDAKNRGADKQDVKRLGKALMLAFNRDQRTRETPYFFSLLVASGSSSIDTRCLNLCLEAYLKNNRPKKLIRVFKQYSRFIKPDHMTIYIILRNFIALKQLDEAEALLRALLDKRGPVTPSSFAILLYGVRETTGNFEEMKRIFEWMKTTGIRVHASIYNIMIKAALDNARYDLAKVFAEEMVARRLKYNTDTFVLFLSTQSKAGDWLGVRRTMERMNEHDLKISSHGFNILLKSYAITTGIPSTEQFFDSMVSHGTIPNKSSYNIMVHASVRAKDEPSTERWIQRMKSAGFSPDATTFNILFQGLRKPKVQPSLLRRVYNAASSINNNLVNLRTKAMLLESMYKSSFIYTRRSRRSVPQDLATDQFLPQIRAMDIATFANRAYDAVCIFSNVMSTGVKPSRPLVTSFVRAALRLPESQHDEPARLFSIAQNRGVPISGIIMSVITSDTSSASTPRNSPTRLNDLLSSLHHTYAFMDANFLPLSHYILVQSAWQLIEDDNPHGAIFLMHQMTNNRWGANVRWNIVGLTVLLKAYIVIGDVNGIGWIVDQVEAEEEVPDKLFMMYLRRSRERAETQEDEKFLGWLLHRCLKLRTKLKEREADEKARWLLRFFQEGDRGA